MSVARNKLHKKEKVTEKRKKWCKEFSSEGRKEDQE